MSYEGNAMQHFLVRFSTDVVRTEYGPYGGTLFLSRRDRNLKSNLEISITLCTVRTTRLSSFVKIK